MERKPSPKLCEFEADQERGVVGREIDVAGSHQDINESGHVQELVRQFTLVDACAVGILTGNSWVAAGGALAVSLSNGGAPGVIYEFIAVSVFYWCVAASLAELASAIPSSGGVYQWASVTAGRYGRVNGFFAGHWNFLAWIFGAASMSSIIGNQLVQMYALFHQDFVAKQWHVFIAYLLVTWLCCAVVLFGNRLLPRINEAGLFLILAGVFISIVTLSTTPITSGGGYATSDFVFRDWENNTGYDSNSFVFLLGMLNGAFAVGTPDCISHIAEEVSHPAKNLPKAIAAQMGIGFVTGLSYLLAVLFSISDLEATLASSSTFPLAEIYRQATGSREGALGLVIVVFLPTLGNLVGCYITAGRTLWTLARDKAVPFSGLIHSVSERWQNPFVATVCCGVIVTILGCIYLGSSTAFNALVGSFVVLSTLSYLAAILPHLLARGKHVKPGPFWMKGLIGPVVNSVAVAYMAVFIVIYCFPYLMPVDAESMNYTSVVVGGWTLLVVGLWVGGSKSYVGPVL